MKLFSTAALQKALARKEESKEKKHTILLVDDEIHNVSTLRDLLSDQYNILTANDGQEALDFIQGNRNSQEIHLIISDQRMPRMSGVEFFCESLKLIPKAKRILLTGFSDVNAIIDSINKGQIYKFILKPFDRHDLLSTVHRALETYDLEVRNDLLLRELRESLAQQKALTQASERFVPFDLLALLQKDSITEVSLGDNVKTEMAVMFSDIRGFTRISETMTPSENFSFVNSYLNRISPIIREHKGFIIKYLGDGMMAVFPQSVEDTVDAGIEKLRMVQHYNIDRKEGDYAPLEIGIGINYGPMMLGMVGDSGRMQGDVLSDAVNLAARLEGLTKRYGVSYIVSHSVIENLKDPTRYHFRALGKAFVRGRGSSVLIYEIFDADPSALFEQKLKTKDDFETGIQHFMTEDFREAARAFQNVLKQFPDDRASNYFKQLSLNKQAIQAAKIPSSR